MPHAGRHPRGARARATAATSSTTAPSALVVDPPRDLTAVERAAEEAGVDIAAVADTHVHNDYVSGALGLARRHGADYLLSADERVEFERVGVARRRRRRRRRPRRPGARHPRPHPAPPVLPGRRDPATGTRRALQRRQPAARHGRPHRPRRRPARPPTSPAPSGPAPARSAPSTPRRVLHPTHGFGSFCAGTTRRRRRRTGHHRRPACRRTRRCCTTGTPSWPSWSPGFGPVPAYYAAHGPAEPRRRRPRRCPRAGAPSRPSERHRRASLRGAWVVDLRDADGVRRGPPAGTVSVEYADQFATYVGWLVPWHDDSCCSPTPRTRLAPGPARPRRDRHRRASGTHVLDAGRTQLTATYRRTDWAELPRTPSRAARRSSSTCASATSTTTATCPARCTCRCRTSSARPRRLPAGELWVHCRSGYRAGIAASLLHRLGRGVVHVDDAWDRVAELAHPDHPGGLAA